MPLRPHPHNGDWFGKVSEPTAFRMGHVVTCLETLRLLVPGPIFLDLDLSLPSPQFPSYPGTSFQPFSSQALETAASRLLRAETAMKAPVSDREERKLPMDVGTTWAELCSRLPMPRVIVISLPPTPFGVEGVKLRAVHMLSTCPSTEAHPQPSCLLLCHPLLLRLCDPRPYIPLLVSVCSSHLEMEVTQVSPSWGVGGVRLSLQAQVSCSCLYCEPPECWGGEINYHCPIQGLWSLVGSGPVAGLSRRP